jgi:hypothetical protein
MRSCRIRKTGLVEGQVDAGSTPAERTCAALAHLARARSLYLRGSGFETCTRLLMGNGVTGIPQAFEALRCASESRFPSSCLRSSSG